MNDKELLELAAKAVGYELWINCNNDNEFYVSNPIRPWNPLTDDGDALRLAVNLSLSFETVESTAWVWFSDEEYPIEERYSGDPYAATRLAIVRAAAEIGKEMK